MANDGGKCLTCVDGSAHSDADGDGTCAPCGDGKFVNMDKISCGNCAANCKVCTDDSVGACIECINGNGFVSGVIGGACAPCGDDKFLNGTFCRNCATNCKVCSDNSVDACTECTDSNGFING